MLQCPDGQYFTPNTTVCLICSSNCQTCENESKLCTSCFMDGGNYVYLYEEVCVANCPAGYYEASNYTCQLCADGCLTCFGDTLKECDSCNVSNSSSEDYYKWANESTCDTSCPDGQFISLRLSHMCEFCSSNCITCFGTADNCTADGGCRTGYFFNNDTF